jgi:DNA (cytosine-5)-methyltransferase 1
MSQLTFGSLFAGIGGFDLGFERAGMRCEWQVEIDPYCQRVLAKHWPNVRRWDDVRTFPPAGDWTVDVICGGFPCQDISNAGKRAGIDGERSGLWAEYARIIRELRPSIVVVENVAALLNRGIERVLGDLAACGYDAEWDCIPASAVGAPHRRDRLFVLAHAPSLRRDGHQPISGSPQEGEEEGRMCKSTGSCEKCRNFFSLYRCNAPDECDCPHCQGMCECGTTDDEPLPDADRRGFFGEKRLATIPSGDRSDDRLPQRNDYWRTEPDVGRVAHGVPARVDRLRGLGNAVVPQVAEWIGRRLVEHARKGGGL